MNVIIDMPKCLLLKLVSVLFGSSYFLFRYQFYQQLDGSAMMAASLIFFKLYVGDSVLAIQKDVVNTTQ